jgi:Flp pilus assembly protein TadD
MPARTYMVVDRRHDHSFRVPRPDLSARLGTPNACNDCHSDKSPEWAAIAIERWHGPKRIGFQKYAQAFHAAWTEQPGAAALLAAVASDPDAPAFARASALTELAPHVSPTNANLAKTGLSDPDPIVRIGALDMLEGAPPSQIWPLVSPLLADSSRGVRIKAAELLAAVPSASQPPADREKFERAAAEFVAAQQLNADRPESRSKLGTFYARRGFAADAEAEYRAAIRLSPQYAPAAINIADLYRQLGRDGEGESVLRTAIAASSGDAGLHYVLGLTLTRLKRHTEALGELHRATELDRDSARYGYVYGVALRSAGHAEEAMMVLRENLVRHPDDRNTLLALISYNRDAGDFKSALENAEHLAETSPGDRDVANLIEDLRRKIKRSDEQ